MCYCTEFTVTPSSVESAQFLTLAVTNLTALLVALEKSCGDIETWSVARGVRSHGAFTWSSTTGRSPADTVTGRCKQLKSIVSHQMEQTTNSNRHTHTPAAHLCGTGCAWSTA
jgi:hypothetical protein